MNIINVSFYVRHKKKYEFVPGLLFLNKVKSIYFDEFSFKSGEVVQLLRIDHVDGTYCHIEKMPLDYFYLYGQNEVL